MITAFKIALPLLLIAWLFKLGYDEAPETASRDFAVAASFTNSRAQVFEAFSSRRAAMGKSSFLMNGIPVEASVYMTKESIAEQVMKFESRWRAQGYQTSTQSLGKMTVVSGVNESAKQFECALLLPDAQNKQTFVIPAQLDLSRPPRQGEFKTPLYPGAQTLFHIESNDLAGNAENLVQVTGAGVPAVMRHYKTQLLQSGWQLVESPKTLRDPQYADQLIFARGPQERWIYAGKMDGQNQTMIFSVHTEK
jgi:hypothetical protein